jgi:hypothetical protein
MAHFFNPSRPYDEHYGEDHGASIAVRGQLKIGLWTGSADLMPIFDSWRVWTCKKPA